VEAFLATPDPSGEPFFFYGMADEFLRFSMTGEFPPDQKEPRALLVLAIAGIRGDLKRLYGDAEDHMLESIALYRGMYRLLYDEDPDDDQHQGDDDQAGEADDESST